VLLQPALQWADKADFNDTLSQLAALFVKNFKVRGNSGGRGGPRCGLFFSAIWAFCF
jgi:hypothetical protein